MNPKKVFLVFGITAFIFILAFCISIIGLKNSSESSKLKDSESVAQPYSLPKPIPVVWLTGR